MHTHISQQEDFTSVCSSASFSFGCIGSAKWIFKNKVWLWTSKLKVMMENVLSEQRAILSWEEWAPVAQIKTCSWSKHQAWNLSWKRLSNFPSSSSPSVSCGDTHLTARKFLQCKSLPGLPVSAGLLLFASPLHSNTRALHTHTHTHWVPICVRSMTFPMWRRTGGGEVLLIAAARPRHRTLDDRSVMKGWKSWAGRRYWADRPLFSTQALSNVVAEWIIWLF